MSDGDGSAEQKRSDSELGLKLEAFLAGKWFLPIIKRLDEFETEMESLFPKASDVLGDDLPSWALNCLRNSLKHDRDCLDFLNPEKIDASMVGNLVGAKWAYFEGAARSHPVWMSLNANQVAKIEAIWGDGFVADVIEITGKIVVKYAPRVREIKRVAMELAEKQVFTELMAYHTGYGKALGLPSLIRRRLQPAKDKREKDFKARLMVQNFAFLCWREIEEKKSELTWRILTDLFAESTHYDDMEEPTLKKILSRSGLRLRELDE